MKKIIDKTKEFAHSIITKETTWNHHLKTLDYLLQLNPNISIEAQIAALTHDIERSTEQGLPPHPDWNNKEYLIAHGKASADITIKFLKNNNYDLNYDKIRELITNHEIGGSPETELIRDADSLSFLEVMPTFFIDKYGSEKSKAKFDFMYNRIKTPKAKEIGKPLYEKALSLLKDEE